MKAQQEMMGIVVMAMIFIVMFLVFIVLSGDEQPVTISQDFVESNLATAALDSLLDTTVECPIGGGAKYRIEGMIQEGKENEECVSNAISGLMDWTFDKYGRGYTLSINDAVIASNGCSDNPHREQAIHSVPYEGGSKEVKLQIC